MTDRPVVYLTMYLGNKLPKWYIGSSKESKILNGYNGSVTSKKYSDIYKSEQKSNKHLFITRILSYHTAVQEALDEELRLQKKHKVVTNDLYINLSYCQRNGFHGGDTSSFIDYDSEITKDKKSKAIMGDKNHRYGYKYSSEEKEELSSFFDRNKKGEDNPNYGRKATKKTKLKQSKNMLGNKNPNYGKHWYNDGLNNYLLFENESGGLIRGKIKTSS